MGTRHEDQPAEHWAGPESLDPTPVWKQYLLVAALALVGLVIVVAVGIAAVLPQIVTPPALVPGDRLVLAASEVPTAGAPARLVASPMVDDARSFYLVQPQRGEVLAIRARWSPRIGEPACRVVPITGRPEPGFTAMDCAVFAPPPAPVFSVRGESQSGSAVRGLDQYLVSVSGDRVVVNLSRVIEASERTNVPVPTGIPQPQQTP